MKSFLMSILIVALLAVGVQADGLNVWLGGDSQSAGTSVDRSLAARVGYRFGEGEPYEIGVGCLWWPSEQMGPPSTYTIYGLYQVGLPIIVPNPIKLDWLPETLTAQPYIGAQVGLDFYNGGVMTGPIAGLIIEKIIVIEYQYQRFTEALANDLDNEHKLFFGLRFAIP